MRSSTSSKRSPGRRCDSQPQASHPPKEERMGLEVKVLDLGDIELDTSFLVLALEPGQAQQVPTLGFLIVGGDAPIVVDTGFSDPAIMGNLGMKGWWRGEQG